jgi:hypothetical protein
MITVSVVAPGDGGMPTVATLFFEKSWDTFLDELEASSEFSHAWWCVCFLASRIAGEINCGGWKADLVLACYRCGA